MNFRCFIALEAPEAVRADLEKHLARFRQVPGVNWVKSANLHLTVLFLGDVDSTRVPELESALTNQARGRDPFSLSVRGLELFPARMPRLVWASLENPGDSLSGFHRDLLKELRQAGFEPDTKALKLHITLGRIKASLPPAMEREIMASEVERGVLGYGRITLYRSVLRPEGPTYHILKQIELS